jgi:hypothetical protein
MLGLLGGVARPRPRNSTTHWWLGRLVSARAAGEGARCSKSAKLRRKLLQGPQVSLPAHPSAPEPRSVGSKESPCSFNDCFFGRNALQATLLVLADEMACPQAVLTLSRGRFDQSSRRAALSGIGATLPVSPCAPARKRPTPQSLGSIGSLSSARMAKTHSWVLRRGAPAVKRVRAS